jgi:hypothetical protein
MAGYTFRQDVVAVLHRLQEAVRAMADAEDRYGTGFYNDPAWRLAYEKARALVGREVAK